MSDATPINLCLVESLVHISVAYPTLSCLVVKRSLGFPGVKNLSAGDIRDVDSIPGSERFPGGGHDMPLHGNSHSHSCLENPMDEGAWQATIHRVAKTWTRLNDLACMQNVAEQPLHGYHKD